MIAARLAFIALLTQGLAAPPSAATLEGTVVQSGSGQPVSGARVQLFRSDPRRGPGAPPAVGDGQPLEPDDLTPRSAVTGQDGRFIFDNVKPGEYRLVALLSGYVPGEFGQRSATGLGIGFGLSPGEQIRGVQLVVTPTGTISGRVYDRDGPVGKLQVLALRPVYRDGRRTLTIVQSVQTDDRGEYRLFWLPPGAYYVAARPFYGAAGPRLGSDPLITSAVHITEPTRVGTFEQASSPVVTSRTLADGEVIDEVQIPVYYPGTTESGDATRLDLRAGANAEGVDIAVTTGAVRAHHLRGVVLVNGQPAAAARVTAVPRTSQPSLSLADGQTGPDGGFDVSGLLPGPYFVFARTNSGLTGGLALQIGDTDIDNLVIPAMPGVRLAGRFVIDGRAPTDADLDLASLRVMLRRDPDVIGMPEAGPAFSPPPALDGSFELQGVQAGDFRVSLRALPRDAYIKSMRLGSADVLDDGLHVTGSPRDALEIVIGANGGAVAGTVVNTRQEPLSNITVAIVPGPSDRQRTYLYRSATSDRSGRFEIRGLAPGSYEAFAWDSPEDGAWLDPDFISVFERQGKSVRIRDGAEENLQLTAITGR